MEEGTLAARVVEPEMAMALAGKETVAIMELMELATKTVLVVIMLLILTIIVRYVVSLLKTTDQKIIRSVFAKLLVREELVTANLVMEMVLVAQQVLVRMG